ncbi:MAG TPA: cytochrome c biogenesis protein CcdA [Acidobacteriota bacterium]|nr:cytochrome c biogenesis protein CcdA [Acidobacteriota bacterium]
MKRFLLLPVLLFCCLSVVSAQKEENAVSVSVTAPADYLPAGEISVLTVVLEIAEPYYINSNRPLQDYLIPTSIELEPWPGVLIGEPVFPDAEIKTLPALGEPMAVFSGTVKITVEITPDESFVGRKVVLQGRLHSQACDGHICFPPVRQPFSHAVTVAAPGSDPASAFARQPESGEMAPADEPSALHLYGDKEGTAYAGAVDFTARGLPLIILLTYLGGLGLALTPCLYPMIPITIAYFGGQSRGGRGSLVLHAVIYVIGMAITYSVLGVAAAMTGGLVGAALQYPAVMIGISAVMAILALSMFDVYELRMPSFLNRPAGGSREGCWGSLFMGLTVGIVAAPCIGPFILGLLTYVGDKGNVFLGFTLFFILALGMGTPYLFLGIFSGNIRRLPRSGAWMIWVRKIFGFALLLLAVYFLRTLFPEPLAYYLTFSLLLALAGIYLAWIDAVAGAGKIFSLVRNIVGMLFFMAALHFAFTGIQNATDRSAALSGGQFMSGGIRWEPYSKEAFDRARRESKPLFIDFYADWCAPCRELDARTFSAPEVSELSNEFVMIKVDLTDVGDPAAESLMRRYRIRGVPTLVFLAPDGGELTMLRGTGFESKDIFIDKMKQALGAGNEKAEPDEPGGR